MLLIARDTVKCQYSFISKTITAVTDVNINNDRGICVYVE